MAEPATSVRFQMQLARLISAFTAAPEIVVEELARGVMGASLLAEREIRERTPTSGAGTLRDSIGAQPIEFARNVVSGGVGTALPYAVPVEFGSKPHTPPVEPIADWVRRKLGKAPEEAADIAQAIVWKIRAHGTEGAHMFSEGFTAVEAQMRAEIEAAADRALERISR